jgi:branched-chain amino acid transport system substrate-binding protein
VKRKLFIASGAALAAGAANFAPAAAEFGDTPIAGTITIGVVAPFTGDSIRLGEQIGNGVRAAIDDANQFRGPLDKAYVMRTFDDQNLLATGMVNAEFACDDPTVVAVIGHLSGRITEGAMQTYTNNKMTVVCPASTYDRLTAHGYGNILRLTTKDSTEGHLAGRYIITSLKPTSAITLYQDGDYGVDVAAGFLDELQSAKIKASALAFSWDKPDFPTVVASTLAAKPDVIYLAGITKDMGPIVPKLRAAGYTGPFFASQGFFDPATAALGDVAEGLTISSSMPPLTLAPGAFRIKNDFERRYGSLTPLSAFSYAAAQIVIAVVRRTGANDRLAVNRALNSTTAFNTVVGSVAFQNDGDPVNPNVYFYTLKSGNWKYTASAVPSSFIVK